MKDNNNSNNNEINMIEPGKPTELEKAATRSFLAKRHHRDELDQDEDHTILINGNNNNTKGTILEAAFVDPSYTWPPEDGQGKNAIELQASLQLIKKNSDEQEEDDSVFTTESARERMKIPDKPIAKEVTTTKKRWLFCCGKSSSSSKDVVVSPEEMRKYEEEKLLAKEARKQHLLSKQEYLKNKERNYQKRNKYTTVPEGILIYRLDTLTGQLSLVSNTHSKTNIDNIPVDCIIMNAIEAGENRRRLLITTSDDIEYTLTACEQRTAISWLEAINIMLAKQQQQSSNRGAGLGLFNNGNMMSRQGSRWSQERLNNEQLNEIEDQYMDLANYSHKLIRAGALPGTKKGSGGAGGIYYSINKIQNDNNTNDIDDEAALEAIAKRRAVIKDSWDFYRMICSLLRDRNRYDEVFRKLQLDPVYPYLNSMTGLNDPGDVGYENLDKSVIQRDLPEYENMTKLQVAEALTKQAEKAMPSLVEICKALAGSLGMEEVGVGPIKDVHAAIRKAEKKYGGDLLKITDYCRALLVVKDFPTLLALLELARDSFGPLISRVKMSTLKRDYKSKPGGYRDCIINVELKGHICEIQIHIWSMWIICGVDGFRHYRHCVEYNTDSFIDPYDALDGLDRKTMAELIVMAEEAVSSTPLDNLEWYHEKYILDYFAEGGLFIKHGLHVWAEITYKKLIKLRTESPDIGPNHHETIILYKYLAQTLRAQGKNDEAKEVTKIVEKAETSKQTEKKEAEKSLWESFGDVYDMVVDPNRKEREEEEKFRKDVKQSKRNWRKIRKERFPFLDVDVEEKKIEG